MKHVSQQHLTVFLSIAAGTTILTSVAALPAAALEGKSAVMAVTSTYKGASIATPYGPVQVVIKVRLKKITAVDAIVIPKGDSRTTIINARAIPLLEGRTLKAQSSKIDGVSGASYTSKAFIKSVQSAIVKAGVQ